jgi:Flp pilus assembly protein TadD
MAEADLRRAAALSVTSDISDSTTAVIQYRLGLLLVMKKDWQGAIEAFRQAATLKPDISLYHQILGDVLTTVGDFAGAQAAYDKAAQ